MTWPTFAFAGAAIALWAWGGYWRDRAQRLAHERDLHRRRARQRQADEVHAEATMAIHGVGDPEAITRYMRDRYGDPTAWRPYDEGGVLGIGSQPGHSCDPPDMRRGEDWTCPDCGITWGAPIPPDTRVWPLNPLLRDDR